MECLKVIYQLVLNFIEWIGWGNIIPVAALITTWYKYNKNKNQQKRNAARIVAMQVKSIYNNVQALDECVQDNLGYDVYKMNQSRCIITENEWDKYKYLFVNELSQTQIETIDLYYEYALLFKEQQDALKHSIKHAYDNFYAKYVETSKEEISTKKAEIRTSPIYTQTIKDNMKTFKIIWGVLPIKELQEIGKMA